MGGRGSPSSEAALARPSLNRTPDCPRPESPTAATDITVDSLNGGQSTSNADSSGTVPIQPLSQTRAHSLQIVKLQNQIQLLQNQRIKDAQAHASLEDTIRNLVENVGYLKGKIAGLTLGLHGIQPNKIAPMDPLEPIDDSADSEQENDTPPEVPRWLMERCLSVNGNMNALTDDILNDFRPKLLATLESMLSNGSRPCDKQFAQESIMKHF